MAVFAITPQEEPERDYRRDPSLKLSLLLIQRGSYPYKDYWALPGGFARPGESTPFSAFRELQEETSIRDAYLRPFGIFSDTGRDPRGWIISHGFLALVNAKDYQLRAGADAWDARWFSIRLTDDEAQKKVTGTNARITKTYHLELENVLLERTLRADIRETRVFEQHHERIDYEILRSDGIAFDHASIILQAFLQLRLLAETEGKIVFDLMPEKFTLNMLQEAQEIILGKELLTPNFRRKMAPLVKETEEFASRAGHRPARLFVRNLEAFYQDTQM